MRSGRARAVTVGVLSAAWMFGWVPMPAAWIGATPGMRGAGEGQSVVDIAARDLGCSQTQTPPKGRPPYTRLLVLRAHTGQVVLLPVGSPRSAFHPGDGFYAWCP